jgi:protein-disulfide isomerase
MTTSSTTDSVSPPGCSLLKRAIGVALALVAVAVIAGCAGSPPASEKNSAAEEGGRSSHSAGVAPGNTPARVGEHPTPRVGLNDDPRMGNAEARIGIVEFTDYECPFCRSFYTQVFPKLKKQYVDTGIVQFISKDLPLTRIHPQALPAALAAICAGNQGKFWEMDQALYTNQERLGIGLYSDLAGNLGLDEGKFSACLDDPAQGRKILRNVDEAQRLGINSTPSFLLGKIEGDTLQVIRLARGAPSFEVFAREIENLRKQVKMDSTAPAK